MRVSLMNLGDAPRVFHNRLNRAVVIPVGRVIAIDMNPMEVQNLQNPAKGETILVGEPDVTEIPPEMQGVVDLLAIIDFESHEKAIQKFMLVVPPDSMTEIRPSRMQMRRYLQTMVEDYVAQQRNPEKEVHDDVDPQVLEDELKKQTDGAKAPPVHALDQEKRDRGAALTEARSAEPPPLRVRGASNAPEARPTKKAAKAGRRG